MSPIVLLTLGLVVVLGGILWVKLHPILALLSGALVVGMLTSDDLLLRFATDKGMSEKATEVFVNQAVGERLAVGFGDTCAKVGLLIVLASNACWIVAQRRKLYARCFPSSVSAGLRPLSWLAVSLSVFRYSLIQSFIS